MLRHDFEATDAPQRVQHDADLQRPLGARVDVLPLTRAAPLGELRARRSDPMRRRLEHLDQASRQIAATLGFDDNANALTRERTGDEHDTTLPLACQRAPTPAPP